MRKKKGYQLLSDVFSFNAMQGNCAYQLLLSVCGSGLIISIAAVQVNGSVITSRGRGINGAGTTLRVIVFWHRGHKKLLERYS